MNKRYCAAPWRGLHINPRGDIKTCCAGDPNMLGNLNTKSISEIMSSSMLDEIRHSVSQGVLHPVYCKNCIEAERYGNSERHWHNSVNQDFDQTSPGEYRPSIIDVRWNTTCNLSCNYCGPKCSSRWAGLMRIQHQSGTRAYYQQVCEYIEQHRDAVREVALVGGEPLLLTENSRLISVLPADVLVTVITNLSVDLTNNAVMQKLQAHNRVGWSISFDNIGERFEYVRHGGQWSLLDHNVRHIDRLRRSQQHYAGIHAVYNLYNCTRLCELRSYADRVGFDIHWQTLFQPDQLNPAMHAPWVRDLARQEIQRYRERFPQTPTDCVFFDRVINELDTNDPDWQEISVKFREHTHLMEHKYHTGCLAFDHLWPELSDI
jgi:MoaA/NifB/PqqE/SkfB family radical SAM enzyme